MNRQNFFVEGFEPIAGPDAEILILGSMPGVRSLEAQRYYAHPRNVFWPLLLDLLGGQVDWSYPQCRQMLITHRIALWDVLQSCHRPGSLDADIVREGLVCNDFAAFYAAHPAIERILFNGSHAEKLYRQHVLPALPVHLSSFSLLRLPSTSPAHAAMSRAQKAEAWRVIVDSIFKD